MLYITVRQILKKKYGIEISYRKLEVILSQNDTFARFRSKRKQQYGSYQTPPNSKHTVAIDLVNFVKNKRTTGFKNAYILIDIFTRFAYCLISKTGKAEELIQLWKKKFGTIPNQQICKVLYSDMGKQIFNKCYFIYFLHLRILNRCRVFWEDESNIFQELRNISIF